MELYQGHVRVSCDPGSYPSSAIYRYGGLLQAPQLPSRAGGLPGRGLLSQEQVVIGTTRDLGCPSGKGIQTTESSPMLGPRLPGA